jgi:hypothetical protein
MVDVCSMNSSISVSVEPDGIYYRSVYGQPWRRIGDKNAVPRNSRRAKEASDDSTPKGERSEESDG